MGLDVDKALEILSEQGPLAQKLKNFEARPQQQMMMRDVIHAYNDDKVALVEAGTGTGKSFAYIIPAILWALENKERTVISTNTIQLQEQLVEKDIPLILKTLNVKLNVVLAKGMNNYACHRKIEDARHEKPLMSCNEKAEFQAIEDWIEVTKDGSRSTLPFIPTGGTWERVGAESDLCTKAQCPHRKACFFYQAREKAEDANILIVNHHLLFADLAIRAETDNYDKTAILPAYNRLILDEAHHIEDIATDYLGKRLTRLGLLRQMGRLLSVKDGKPTGKFPILTEMIQKNTKGDPDRQVQSVLNRLTIDLPGMDATISNQIKNSFNTFAEFAGSFSNIEDAHDRKLRLLQTHKNDIRWKEEVVPRTKQLVDDIKRFEQALHHLNRDIADFEDENLSNMTKGIRADIQAFSGRIGDSGRILQEFISEEMPLSKVRWIEAKPMKTIVNAHVVDVELDVSKALVNYLFDKVPTIVLCSATLTTNREFQFYKKQVGLTPEQAPKIQTVESVYDSPFNYHEQALLTVPYDAPLPDNKLFTKAATENIWRAVYASHGNAFVLFTSYSMMRQCYNDLQKRFREHRFNPFMQGEDNRQALLKKFKESPKAVLFGTDSFWEGVDVAGEDLRCVIITKLPFRVPTEPIIQARTEAIQEAGGKPFYEYTVPHAIVKFKQGFGRLIRHKRDRGCIVCLDSRICSKPYGKLFLNSLPPCRKLFLKSDDLQKEMTNFYRKSYYLTKKG